MNKQIFKYEEDENEIELKINDNNIKNDNKIEIKFVSSEN